MDYEFVPGRDDVPADEIESLRQALKDSDKLAEEWMFRVQEAEQRIAELEEFNLIHKDEIKLLVAELAAIKGKQEPVAAWNGEYDHDGNAIEVPINHAPIPEGYVMVPVEPTSEMFDAAEVAFESGSDGIWHAMLAAAPKPEELICPSCNVNKEIHPCPAINGNCPMEGKAAAPKPEESK